jgi:D-3-phosphoglycerate dehydrogenase
MRVYFYDIENKLSLGNATQVHTMSELLNKCDVITLHVPETDGTKNMMGEAEFARMKPGSIFINAARGTVVDIPALASALDTGHLSGAAIDVFPVEPKTNADPFESPLIQFDNCILTPHVIGSTLSSVSFHEVSLPEHLDASRLLHIHENRPGILTQINTSFAEEGINIVGQYLQTNSEMGYVVIDVESDRSEEALKKLKKH